MRFDDMIATVLAQAADRPDRQAARWRQLVDLLAQNRPETGGEAAGRAYALLRETRASIEPDIRRQSALALAGRAIDPDLLAFFAEDAPAVPLRSSPALASMPRAGSRSCPDWDPPREPCCAIATISTPR